MDKVTSIKVLLDKIREQEGVQFECDEEAILNTYKTKDEHTASLAIKLLTIFGGFLATFTFLGFLTITGLYNSEFGLLFFGILFLFAAVRLHKVYNKLIVDTFSISMYVIGFALLSTGLSQLNIDENLIALLIGGIAFGCLFINQNYILSFISTLLIGGSCMFLILNSNAYDLIHLYIAVNTLVLVYCFLNEAKIISSHKKGLQLYNPIRIGLIGTLLFGLIAIGKRDLIPITENRIWLSSVVMILVTLYLVHMILKINGVTSVKSKASVYVMSGLVVACTLFSPSISGAIVILLLSFLVRYKTGVVIGIISMLYFISQYYYDLSFTLLTKSVMLLVSGIALLLLYVFTTQKNKR